MADSTLTLPGLHAIHQRVNSPHVIDVEQAVDAALDRSKMLDPVQLGARVVIAVGSRGIPNYARVIGRIITRLRALGAFPVILPAMGSHGGGTAGGQAQLLTEQGIPLEGTGASIVDTMVVAPLGTSPSGIQVLADESLLASEHILVVNRIKEHTDFSGRIESGWLKMMAVGFGRVCGAVEIHRWAAGLGFERTIREAAGVYFDHLPILGAVGLVDAPGGGTARIDAANAISMVAAEAGLLEFARQVTPRLPLDQVDILIVDEMGKDISGTGMDTKVIGRLLNAFEPEPEQPKITRIFVRDLTPGTHGNALGVGLADFTTRKLVSKIDPAVTNVNAITAIAPEKARLPMVFESDKSALKAARETIGRKRDDEIRLVWIRNTSALVDFLASPAAVAAMPADQVEVRTETLTISCDATGELIKPLSADPREQA